LQEADPARWLDALDHLRRLRAETLVPGHGPVCDKVYLKEQEAFIREWVDYVRSGVGRGLTKDQCVESLTAMTDRYPMDVEQEGYAPRVMKMNVANLFDYVTGAGFHTLPHCWCCADDQITVFLQCVRQWDGLGHIFHNGKMYGGRDAALVSSNGAAKNGIEHYKDRIASRGVLLDMARFKGVDAMRPGEAIYVEDLEACAAKQRVTVEPGDIVLIRTGDVGRRVREKSWGTFSAGDAPGLSFHTAPWLYGKSIAGIATDTWGAEVRPNEL